MSAPTPTKGTWRGHDWWFCPECPFDSDDEAAAVEHCRTRHRPEEPTELQRETAAARAAEERAAARRKPAKEPEPEATTETATEEPADG